MKKRHHKYLFVVLAMMGCVAALQSAAQSLERVSPEKVEKISASLDKSLLPHGGNFFNVERNQVVAAQGITFVPVRFDAVDKAATLDVPGISSPRTKFYCGLYQLAEGAPAKFLLSFGIGQTEAAECEGMKAIGAATPRAAHGDLILIYTGYTLHSTAPTPVILSWDDTQKQYVVNDDLTEYVGTNLTKSCTIFNIRSLLASRAAKP
jgi:hypothetical protein